MAINMARLCERRREGAAFGDVALVCRSAASAEPVLQVIFQRGESPSLAVTSSRCMQCTTDTRTTGEGFSVSPTIMDYVSWLLIHNLMHGSK